MQNGEAMKVSGVTMVILVLNMLIGIAIPLGLAIFFRKKYRCPLVPFWAGCGVMFLSETDSTYCCAEFPGRKSDKRKFLADGTVRRSNGRAF